MSLFIRVVFLVSSMTVLCGCAYNDYFDNKVARYDYAAEQARDSMILTNVIRASRAEPLSFLQLGQVSGSNTASGTVGLPSIVLGALSPVAATATLQREVVFGGNAAGGNGYTGNSTTLSGTVNIQVTPSESKQFYHGLLSEVDPRTLQFFVQQGISRELLYYLFTERLTETKGGKTIEIRNDPLSETFPAFQRSVRLALDYGLSSEEKPSSVRKRRASTSKDTKVDEVTDQDYQLCFDRSLMTAREGIQYLRPICGSGVDSSEAHTVAFHAVDGEPIVLRILPRSAFAIFRYLGRIVAAGDQGLIRLESKEAIDNGPFTDDYLFFIQKGVNSACFIAIEYEGERYCVPLNGDSNTKRVLSLLTQLIALNTSSSDIAIAPIVRVVP